MTRRVPREIITNAGRMRVRPGYLQKHLDVAGYIALHYPGSVEIASIHDFMHRTRGTMSVDTAAVMWDLLDDGVIENLYNGRVRWRK